MRNKISPLGWCLIVLVTAVASWGGTITKLNPFTGKPDFVGTFSNNSTSYWGTIAGTITDQSDLQSSLGQKLSVSVFNAYTSNDRATVAGLNAAVSEFRSYTSVDRLTVSAFAAYTSIDRAGGGGSGIVGSGTEGQFAYYNADGTSVQGKSILTSDVVGLNTTYTAQSTFTAYTSQDRPTNDDVAAEYTAKGALEPYERDVKTALESPTAITTLEGFTAAIAAGGYYSLNATITLTDDITINNRNFRLTGNGSGVITTAAVYKRLIISNFAEISNVTFTNVAIDVPVTARIQEAKIHDCTFNNFGILLGNNVTAHGTAALNAKGMKIYNNKFVNADMGTLILGVGGYAPPSVGGIGGMFNYAEIFNNEFRYTAAATINDWALPIRVNGSHNKVYKNRIYGADQPIMQGIHINVMFEGENDQGNYNIVEGNEIYDVTAESIGQESQLNSLFVSGTVTAVNATNKTITFTPVFTYASSPSTWENASLYIVNGTAEGDITKVFSVSIGATYTATVSNYQNFSAISVGDWLGIGKIPTGNIYRNNIIKQSAFKTLTGSEGNRVGISLWCGGYDNYIYNNTLVNTGYPISVQGFRSTATTNGRFCPSIANQISDNTIVNYNGGIELRSQQGRNTGATQITHSGTNYYCTVAHTSDTGNQPPHYGYWREGGDGSGGVWSAGQSYVAGSTPIIRGVLNTYSNNVVSGGDTSAGLIYTHSKLISVAGNTIDTTSDFNSDVTYADNRDLLSPTANPADGAAGVIQISDGAGNNTSVSQFLIDNSTKRMVARAYTGEDTEPRYIGQVAKGTAASPLAADGSVNAITLTGQAWDGDSFETLGSWIMRPTETISGTARGGVHKFTTAAPGTTTYGERFTLDGKGNVSIGEVAYATDKTGTNTLFQTSGTAPTTQPADGAQMYVADVNGAGTAGFHFMDESGSVVKIAPPLKGYSTPTVTEIAPGGTIASTDNVIILTSGASNTTLLPSYSSMVSGAWYQIINKSGNSQTIGVQTGQRADFVTNGTYTLPSGKTLTVKYLIGNSYTTTWWNMGDGNDGGSGTFPSVTVGDTTYTNAQIHLTTNGADSGGYVFSDGASIIRLGAGTYYNGSSWVNKTANYGAIQHSGTDFAVRFGTDGPSSTPPATKFSVTNAGAVIFATSSSPASNAACTAGTITWDASYIYVCTASGAWKRSALTGGY